MPDAYGVHEAQFIQQRSATSAANALVIAVGPVPEGRVWTIFRAVGICSVAETQNYWYAVVTATGGEFPVTIPVSFTTAPAQSQNFPALTEGMELKLFPGESLYLRRQAATAGSTIAIYASLIESELQYYFELDRHKEILRKQSRPESFLRKLAAARSGGTPSRGEPTGGRGRTGALPI